MLRVIRIYIKQRFRLQLYLPLAVLLILFGIKEYNVPLTEWLRQLSLLPITLAFLLLFRLADDLMSRKEDGIQPNRVYTKKESWFPLVVFSSIILFLGIGFVLNDYETYVTSYILVLLFSFIPYAANLLAKQFKFILPLFKYGIFVLFITSLQGQLEPFDYVFSGVVFMSFILYELLEDERLVAYKNHVKWMYWLLILPFGYMYPDALLWIGVLSISVYLFWLLKRPSYIHYYILLLVLSLKIIVYVV